MENIELNDVAEEDDEEDEDDLGAEEDDEEEDDASAGGDAVVPNGVLEGGVAEPLDPKKPRRTASQADIVRCVFVRISSFSASLLT